MTTAAETFAAFAVDFARGPIPRNVAHHAKRAVIDWYAALLAGAGHRAGDAAREGARRRSRSRPRAAGARPQGDAAHRGPDQRHGRARRRGRRHLPRRDLSPRRADHRRRAGRGAGRRRERRSFPQGRDRRLRDLDADRRRDGPRALQATGTTPAPSARSAPPPRRPASMAWMPPGSRMRWPPAARSRPGCSRRSASDSMSKPLHAGRAAEAGVAAAQMARAGVTGALDIIDGEAGHRPRHGRRARLEQGAWRRSAASSTSRR